MEYGLIGYPLSHSLSPVIHRAALQELGIPGAYRLYPIAALPEGEHALAGLLDRLRTGEIHGLNVTIPHKQSILKGVDRLTLTAQEIGAVNTLLRSGGELVGENTDADGFMADIRLKFKRDIGKNALILGAGGSARAIVYALLKDGFHVTVAARRLNQANALTGHFQGFSARLAGIELERPSLTSWVSSISKEQTLVVNCTPLGMTPHIETSPWPEGIPFPARSLIYDLVYNPVETRFVSQARQAGLNAFSGLGMLVEQAAISFELWTGRDAPRQIMHAAALNTL